jgi:transcriptional regulator with XRE-family HTH domain
MGDDHQIGRMVRDVRRAHGFSQEVVAGRAGVSRQMLSRLERGLVDDFKIAHLRAISRALEMPSLVSLGWRGPEIDRLRDQGHAALVEMLAGTLVGAGWELIPEYTFSHFGEKGAVDSLAWHATS